MASQKYRYFRTNPDGSWTEIKPPRKAPNKYRKELVWRHGWYIAHLLPIDTPDFDCATSICGHVNRFHLPWDDDYIPDPELMCGRCLRAQAANNKKPWPPGHDD